MKRVFPIIYKELIQMRRDRPTLAMMLLLPVVQLLLFGFAVNTDVKHLPTVVWDQSRSRASREILDAFKHSQYYDLRYSAGSYREVTAYLDSGMARVGIVFPPDFARKLKRGESAPVQVIVDASDPMTASSAISTSQLIGQLKSLEIVTSSFPGRGSGFEEAPPVDVRVRTWYNPDLLSVNFMVPGLLGVILTIAMVLFTAMAVVRERERGTLEQLIVTPVRPAELMIGKILPYMAVALVMMTLALLAGVLVFRVPINGSIGLLYLLSLVFMLACLGIGLLISTVARNQQQAMQMAFFVIFPTILLSGFVFPREAMPPFFYALGYLVPATYFLQILRGIILKGIGLNYLWPQVVSLLVFGLIVNFVSILRFRKRLS
ncbi:MAG: ABC transporter permease [Bacillota bacterium]|jgi:ABC-2 type transport system permease protein|nr:ABC transporter permease [Bacillota bacterium]